jgi:hypothetical protein
MKKSNISLLILLAILLTTLVVAPIILKREMDRGIAGSPIKENRFTKLTPYKYIKLTGLSEGTVSIHRGDVYQIQTWGDSSALVYEVRNDTLIVAAQKKATPMVMSGRMYPLADLYTPELYTLISIDMDCSLHGFRQGQLSIHQHGGQVSLSENQVDTLRAQIEASGILEINNTNRFETGHLTIGTTGTATYPSEVFAHLKRNEHVYVSYETRDRLFKGLKDLTPKLITENLVILKGKGIHP